MISDWPRNWRSFVQHGAVAILISVLSVVWLRLSQAFLVVLFGLCFHQWLPDVVLRHIR